MRRQYDWTDGWPLVTREDFSAALGCLGTVALFVLIVFLAGLDNIR